MAIAMRGRVCVRLACAGIASLLALSCSEAVMSPEEMLCARLVRFHRGLHHPVEVIDSEHTPEKPRVRISYRGTRNESSSVDGVALCRLTDLFYLLRNGLALGPARQDLDSMPRPLRALVGEALMRAHNPSDEILSTRERKFPYLTTQKSTTAPANP